jgi:cytochrome c oxidase subunit 2
MEMATVPERYWWYEKVEPLEKIWLILAFLLVVVFFSAWMLIWHVIGPQNSTGKAYRVDPAAFKAEVEQFVAKYRVGEENGRPVVEPPAGSDVYLYATRFAFYPILRLRAGERYLLHIAALDYLHGFSISNPHQWNIQLYPGYEWVLPFTPTEPGVYNVVCNEYCGIGHEMMVGKILVVER